MEETPLASIPNMTPGELKRFREQGLHFVSHLGDLTVREMWVLAPKSFAQLLQKMTEEGVRFADCDQTVVDLLADDTKQLRIDTYLRNALARSDVTSFELLQRLRLSDLKEALRGMMGEERTVRLLAALRAKGLSLAEEE